MIVSHVDAYGIPDSWKIRYFGSTNAVNGGALDDWDHDGANNLQEWLAGTDPTTAASALRLSDVRTESNGTNGTVIVLVWSSESNKSYGIGYSSNLISGFDPLVTNIIGTYPINTRTLDVGRAQSGFFVIRLEP